MELKNIINIMIVLYLLLFICLILIYIKSASKFGLLDIPNDRSSHTTITVRGGGVIFPIAILLAYFLSSDQYHFFLAAILLLSIVSFVDDKYSISSGWRFIVQIIASILLIIELDLSYFIIPFTLFVLVGGVNAFNFMDGINGITAMYSIVTLGTLYLINIQFAFVESYYILLPLLAVIAFAFFNVRKKALCFAGDVGSISIALIILFLVIKLVLTTQDLSYFLLLFIYALDSGATIIKRKMQGQNILKPHREHLYQQLVHKTNWTHLQVSFLFAITQIVINLFVVFLQLNIYWIIFSSSILVISYIFALKYIIKRER